jgi:hypothetical protein
MVRMNPELQREMLKLEDFVNKISAREIAGQLIDNMGTQEGTGIHWFGLPNRSSLRSMAAPVAVGQIPSTPQDAEFSVVQSGGYVGSVDAKRADDGEGWEFGFFNVDIEQAITQELGTDLVAPRANIYRTVVAEETRRRIMEELKRNV